MRDFYKLDIWKRSHDMTLAIYKITDRFPLTEQFGLASQLRRAMSSVPTNIVEGCGRESNNDFARFLQIAIGSAAEVEYWLLLAHDLTYITKQEYIKLQNEIIVIRKMIINFCETIKKDSSSSKTQSSKL